jgi:hypothetical protein
MGTRVKTFVSTGLATDGRLYAPDLNNIQDDYADQSNFAQTVDVASVRFGDSSIQLLKFGTSEGSFTGSLRVSAILRGLGGLLAGAFTTAQRDAISAGSRPYGLAILNSDKNVYEYNAGSDATPNWRSLGGQLVGDYASRPSATTSSGLFYFATDTGGLFYSDGATWLLIQQRAVRMNVTSFLSATAYDGRRVLVDVGGDAAWEFVYSATNARWEAVGKTVPLNAYVQSEFTATTSGIQSMPGNQPFIDVPLQGTYDVKGQFSWIQNAAGFALWLNSAVTGNIDTARASGFSDLVLANLGGWVGGEIRMANLARNATVKMNYQQLDNANGAGHIYGRNIWVTPVYVTQA